jgi:hypothetical protein
MYPTVFVPKAFHQISNKTIDHGEWCSWDKNTALMNPAVV